MGIWEGRAAAVLAGVAGIAGRGGWTISCAGFRGAECATSATGSGVWFASAAGVAAGGVGAGVGRGRFGAWATVAGNFANVSNQTAAALPIPKVLNGVSVTVGGVEAPVYFVSSAQINFLVPSILIPGPSDVQVALDARGGPDVKIQIGRRDPP